MTAYLMNLPLIRIELMKNNSFRERGNRKVPWIYHNATKVKQNRHKGISNPKSNPSLILQFTKYYMPH